MFSFFFKSWLILVNIRPASQYYPFNQNEFNTIQSLFQSNINKESGSVSISSNLPYQHWRRVASISMLEILYDLKISSPNSSSKLKILEKYIK
jgi:ubiquitin-protein ligase